jgi:hypothetical protein
MEFVDNLPPPTGHPLPTIETAASRPEQFSQDLTSLAWD